MVTLGLSGQKLRNSKRVWRGRWKKTVGLRLIGTELSFQNLHRVDVYGFRFKLQMAPITTENSAIQGLSSLPEGKTIVDVFSDFLRYLYNCTQTYIQDTHLPNGGALWDSVKSDIHYVLSHPNGWEGAQQAQMRHAAVVAGLIPDTNKGQARIRFVTEGEAGLHFCILSGLSTDAIAVNVFPLDLVSSSLILDLTERRRCNHCRCWWWDNRFKRLRV